jgi:hypothetical protein
MRRLSLGVPQSAMPAVEGSAQLGTKRPAEDDELSASHILRSVALGSRKQLCINESLRRRHGDLDEACRQLLNGWSLNSSRASDLTVVLGVCLVRVRLWHERYHRKGR